MAISQAARAADLVNSMGVATHILYTDGGYANIGQDLSSLQYLGLNHVRDAAPNPANQGQDHLNDAANAGVKFVFYAEAGVDPNTVVQRLHAFAVAHPGSIAGIEGPNEVNNWPVTYQGQTGTAAAQAYQKALFSAVNADPLLKDVPVIGFTDYPNHTSASDYNNTHPYAKNGDQPRSAIVGNKADQDAVDPGKPFVLTETGYHTSLTADTNGGWEGVDASTQAKLLLNTYMDAAELGAKGTYIYQLLDAYKDPSGSDQEQHFGLFNLDYSPKLAATAIHNLTTIMKDGGSSATSFNPGSLNYSVTGLPSSGHVYLTAKSDGSFQLTAWNEPDIWDQANDRAISVAAQNVHVNLGASFSTVQVFDPMVGTAAVQTLHNVSAVDLGLTDHPLIVQVSGGSSAIPPVTTPPVTTPPVTTPPVTTPPVTTPPASAGGTIGSGSDKIVLKVSQDKYQDDAQFVVKVDGKQVGGVQTAHAVHGSGSDTLTVLGTIGSGAHQVTVSFINDADGGGGQDRNLYLDGATYNGATVSGANHQYLWNHEFNFNFTGASSGAVTPPVTTPPVTTPPVTAPPVTTPPVTTPPVTTPPVTTPPAAAGATIGSGSDKFVLKVSQDQWKEDAQFTVKVDGKQIGGVQTAHAVHGSGQADALNVLGTFGAGKHDVSVTFVNDGYGGAGLDRNFYLESATYNGTNVPGVNHQFLWNQEFNFNVAATSGGSGAVTPPVSNPTPPVTTPPVTTPPVTTPPATVGGTIGSGPDKVILKVSQDKWQEDAQFVVKVDGKQVGGVQSAHAEHSAHQYDVLNVLGNFAGGHHDISVTFLNDGWGGQGLDRNMYLEGATYNGVSLMNGDHQFAYNSEFHVGL